MTDKEKRLNQAKRTLESVNATHATLAGSMEKAERAAVSAFAHGTVTGECIADRARTLYLESLLMLHDCERVRDRLTALIDSLERRE